MITYFLFSKPGDRDNNEDNVGMSRNGQDFCFVLADGLGGHGGGEFASKIAVEKTIETFAAGQAGPECLAQSFRDAENEILRRQKEERSLADMKTTCVTLMIGPDGIQWGHIGDSRLYYFVNGKLETRTLDHSVPQMLAAAGRIREKDIRHHPDRNRLLRAMGIEWDGDRFTLAEPARRSGRTQQFLLCTDGFWELIDEKKMAACLKHAETPEAWILSMEEIIRKNGRNLNMDNYSAVAVWVSGENCVRQSFDAVRAIIMTTEGRHRKRGS